MADFYLDHGAYGGSNRYGIDTPTWGVPQEGDGTAMAAASASSVASIAFSANPTSGQTCSILGVTFTAGTTYTIGANTDATANNLATAINSSGTSTGFGILLSQIALNRIVYARGPSGGAPSGTVQIMLRIGSAGLNQANNSNVTITSTFTTATITQFAGGSGGCFGYAFNEATMFSSVSVATYGAFQGIAYWCSNGTGLYTPTAQDTLWVRTGSNKTVALTPQGSTSSARGVMLYRVVFDTNTKWTGDSANGVLTLAYTMTNGTHQMSLGGRYTCLRRGNLKITTSASANPLMIVPNGGGCAVVEGFAIVDGTTSTTQPGVQFTPSTTMIVAISSMAWISWVGCDYTRSQSGATLPPMFTVMWTTFAARVKFDSCTFNFTVTGSSDPGAMFAWSSPSVSQQYPVGVQLTNCRFNTSGYAGGLTVYPTGQPTWVNSFLGIEIRIDNCSGLRLATANSGLPTSGLNNFDPDFHVAYTNLGSNGFRYENIRGMCDWVPSDAPPYLSAKLPDGTTSWSLRVLWMTLPSHTLPFALPQFHCYNRLSSGARTVGFELMAPNTLTYTDSMLRLTVTYTDDTGVQRVESTGTVAASTATWSSMTGMDAKKITLTTANNVAANTEIQAKLEFTTPPSSGANTYAYVNPEPSIT